MHEVIASLERRTYRLIRSVQADTAWAIVEGDILLLLKALELDPLSEEAVEAALLASLHQYRQAKAPLLEEAYRLLAPTPLAGMISDGDDLFVIAERGLANRDLGADPAPLERVLALREPLQQLNSHLNEQVQQLVAEAARG